LNVAQHFMCQRANTISITFLRIYFELDKVFFFSSNLFKSRKK